MTTTFTAAAQTADQLTDSLLAPPTAQPLSGDIMTRGAKAFSSPDGRIDVGTWETETGTSRWEFLAEGEIIVVISGHMTVAEDGGEPAELHAGDTAIFPVGWKGVWTVHERLRKVYVTYAQ